jgi:hypothetical protein
VTTAELESEIVTLRPDLSREHLRRQIQRMAEITIWSPLVWLEETVRCARDGLPLPWEAGYSLWRL